MDLRIGPLKRWTRAIVALALLAAVGAGSAAWARPRKTYVDERDFARARVVKIEKRFADDGQTGLSEIRVHLRILDGEKKGQRHTAVYRGEDDMPRDMFYREGDTVFIGISRVGGVDAVEYISIYDVDNTAGIIVMLVFFIVAVIAVGRLRGALSMLSLLVTIVLLFYVLIPYTLRGHSPLPIAVGISLFAIVITIPIILGFRKKALAAILGAASGVLISTVLALIAGGIMHLSGIVTNEMMTVFYASSVDINVRGLALAGFIIAALGAIMDVCISISSAAEELFRVHPEVSVASAMKSVMTVSADMLGATVNTLLFAYVGSALPMVLLIALRFEQGTPLMMVFNYNPVLSELVKSAVGCIGMFLSMPASAFICIELHKRSRHRNKAAS